MLNFYIFFILFCLSSSQLLQLVSKNLSYVARNFDVLLEISYLADLSVLPSSRICILEDEISDTCITPTGPSVKITLDYGSSERQGEINFTFRLCRSGEPDVHLICNAAPIIYTVFMLPQSRTSNELTSYFFRGIELAPADSSSFGVASQVVVILHTATPGMVEAPLLSKHLLDVIALGIGKLSVILDDHLHTDPFVGTVLSRLCSRHQKFGGISGVSCCNTSRYHSCVPASFDILYYIELSGATAMASSSTDAGYSTLQVLQTVHTSVRRYSLVLSIGRGCSPTGPAQRYIQSAGGGDGSAAGFIGLHQEVLVGGMSMWVASAVHSPPDVNLGVSASHHPFHGVFRGVPSRAMFSIDYGVNVAVLDHVCSHSGSGARTSLELYSAMGATPVLSQDVLRMLNESTNSGFYTAHPTEAGWRFTNAPIAPPLDGPGGNAPSPVHLFDGVTVALSAPFANNIFHVTQILTTLFHLKLYSDHVNINIDTKRNGSGHRWVDRTWVHKLRSVNMPTFARSKELEWSASLLAAVTALMSVQPGTGVRISGADMEEYFREHLPGHDFEGATAATTPRLRVYTAEDYDMLADALGQDGYFCYEKLVVAGTMELSVAFINSPEDADLFRQFVYQFFDVPAAVIPGIASRRKQLQTTVEPPRLQPHTPNHRLNIVILLRSQKKNIMNVPAILAMLRHTGLVTVPDAMLGCWQDRGAGHACYDASEGATVHVYYFDFYPLAQQVRVLAATDVLITPHGAGVINLVYLRRHSAVIEVMTSPWYELGYQATAVGMGLAYYVLPVTSSSVVHNQDGERAVRPAFSCPYPVPAECFRTPLLLSRRELVCYNIRLCDIEVDTEALEVMVWQASQVVRLFKANVHGLRGGSYWDGIGTDIVGVADPHIVQFYRKAYVLPLESH
jgi:hypothetical protein